MPTIKIKDLNFYYEFHGEGEPLVLISGTASSGEYWKVFQVPDLSKHFQVLTWDHRGTGRSDKPDIPYSTRMFAEDCVNLMRALSIERAHVMGHSMGGRVAQWVAIDHPECVASLILSGSGRPSKYPHVGIDVERRPQLYPPCPMASDVSGFGDFRHRSRN